ncbi:MAG: TetR/AcrR family transcriptional regulator [Pseudomonadota bacterium]|nr:TetR/AcrR family transcriptional regulator [Pseudomonadota bacterium]
MTAAESIFASYGYDAATVRKIAVEADVPVALVNYHFGSKEGLYRAIFEKRAPMVVDQRETGLKLANAEPDLDRRIDLVVRAVMLPMFGYRENERGQNFARLVTREMTDPQSEARGVFREMFDSIALKVLDAIAECFPDWTKTEVHWAYHTMLGAMSLIVLDNGRIERLSGGEVRPDDWEQAATHVTAIIAAGFKHRDRTQTRGG